MVPGSDMIHAWIGATGPYRRNCRTLFNSPSTAYFAKADCESMLHFTTHTRSFHMFSKTVRTKKSKADVTSTETKVQVDFTGCTQDQIEALAAAAVIINEQGIWREGTIPAECTIVVREQLARPRGGGFKMTPEAVMKNALADPAFMSEVDAGLQAE